MRRITCADCGRRYDYDTDDFCPKCGSYNPPPDGGATRLERELLARFQGGRAAPAEARTAAPRTPSAQPKTPPAGARTVTYGGGPEVAPGRGHAPRIQGCEACETPRKRPTARIVLLAAAIFLLILAAPLVTGLTAVFSRLARPAPEPEAQPQGGYHELWEPFAINGGQEVTVEEPWEVGLSYLPLAAREGFHCLAVDIWVEGGQRQDGRTFFLPELLLEDGALIQAEDDATVARSLKEAGVYLVTLADAQWEDPMYGQLIFYVPEGTDGPVSLLLYEAAEGETEPSATHMIPLELPWSTGAAL